MLKQKTPGEIRDQQKQRKRDNKEAKVQFGFLIFLINGIRYYFPIMASPFTIYFCFNI